MFFFLFWYLPGLLGSYLLWLYWVCEFETYRCPTLRSILLSLIGALFGWSILFVSCLMWLVDWIITGGPSLPKWFITPICRKRK